MPNYNTILGARLVCDFFWASSDSHNPTATIRPAQAQPWEHPSAELQYDSWRTPFLQLFRISRKSQNPQDSGDDRVRPAVAQEAPRCQISI